MYKRQHAAAVLVTCVALTTGVSPQTSAQNLNSSTLLEQGLSLKEAGNAQAAKELLEQIDAITLNKEQRQTLYSALTELEDVAVQAPQVAADAPAAAAEQETAVEVVVEQEAAEAPAEPTPAEVLAQADAAAQTDPGTAIALYNSLVENGGSEGETAQARMADLLRELNSDTTRAKRALDSAEADLAAGRYDSAKEKFDFVAQSGVELGWFGEQRIARGLDRIAEAKPVKAAPAPAPQTQVAVKPTPKTAPASSAPVPVSVSNDLIVEARKAVADEYHADAKAALAQGYNGLAVNLLSQAEELDPNNPEIQASLAQATASSSPALDGAVDTFKLRRDAAQAAYDEAMNKANAKLENRDYAGAGDEVARAKTTIENNQEFFSVSEFEARRKAATDLSVRINEQQIAAAIAADRDAREKAEADERDARQKAEKENAEEVRNLIIQARRLQKELKYEDALLLLDQALFKEPTNFTAQLLKEVIEDALISTQAVAIERELRLEGAKDALLNREAIIPYTDLITFPEDWPELSDRRIRGLDDTGGESEVNRETALRLKTTVPINFDANPLESVIGFIRETTGANIFVNWPALIDSAGIEQDQPISLTLNNVPADRALELILQQASASGFEPIGFSIIEGVVTISTVEDLTRSTDLRVYDIRDLLVQVPNFTDAPEFSLEDALESGGGDGGGGGGSSIFGDDDDNDEDEEEITRQELIDQITQLIEETVGTIEEWVDEESTVRELNSNLIIKTTPENHRQINALLAQLRETRAIQISVEARFLLVDRNFLENVQVDFDLAFQGEQDGGLVNNPFEPGFFIFELDEDGNLTDEVLTDALGIAQTTGGVPVQQGFQPIAASQGSNVLSSPIEDALSFAPFFSGPSGLNLGVSFIDDISVNFLLDATAANRNAISLTAPRVTFFNGQRAYVVVTQQVAFVSDLEPVPDAAGFDVTVSTINGGVVLDVEGTISADRRYVTMTLRPSLADIVDIVDFPLSGSAVVADDDFAFVEDFDVAIQLPILDITTVRATVSVPDRGTLLLGGQRLVADADIEAGVPVLSKLPLLNRLFTNTSKTEDERTLLILIRPEIIIQNEREESAYPGITDNLRELGQSIN